VIARDTDMLICFLGRSPENAAVRSTSGWLDPLGVHCPPAWNWARRGRHWRSWPSAKRICGRRAVLHIARLTHILGAWIPFMPSTRSSIDISKRENPLQPSSRW